MRKIIVLLLAVLVCSTAWSQDHSLGLRLGDPIGATYKRQVGNNRAVEFILGTAPKEWRRDYHRKSFYEYSKYDGFNYISHRLDNPVYLQARYLLHYDIPVEGMEGNLQWYWGAGGMLKFGKIEYHYRERPPNNGTRRDVRNTIDFGPEGIGGVEYTFEDTPLNVFGEVSLLLEIADRPLTFQVFGAVGARFLLQN
ncbi:MAG TPA: hypothetical protein VKZ86_11335 [Cyclobacteriaceae bacterium]|nr:hypothetical protein [Cyclobacteriaceae bacterium]